MKSKQNPDVLVINTQSLIPESREIEINQTEQSVNITNQLKEILMPASEKMAPQIPRPRKESSKNEMSKEEEISLEKPE